MTREFLEELNLEEPVAEAIWQAHHQALRQVQFDHDLEKAITQAGGRNHKAIAALLDIPGLQEAPEGLAQALQTLKKEQAYLFATPPVYARATGTHNPLPEPPATLASALRERFEKRK